MCFMPWIMTIMNLPGSASGDTATLRPRLPTTGKSFWTHLAGRQTDNPNMSAFLASPRLLKGAMIGIDPFNPLASATVFQYNPQKLTRSLHGYLMVRKAA